MRQRTLVPFQALAILLAAAPIVTAQAHPNLEPGFYAEKAYQVGDIDHVNLFNGVLAVTIPIGDEYAVNAGFSYRLTLVYSSSVWDFKGRDAGGGVTYTQAIPCQRCNSGAGFSLSLGRLYAPSDPLNTTPNKARWQYVAPDGSEHAFYATLHEGETAGSPLYTRHGTYLRLKEVNSTTRTVEFPDGQIHTFGYNATYKWRLTQIADRYSNYLNVTYPTTSRWDLTDRHGRVHQVNFRTSAPGLNQVSTVVLKAFNGTTATYTFSYADTVIDRNLKDDDPTTSTTLTVPLLTGVALPDGSSYAMPTATSYCTTSSDTGMLKKLGLPTGGSINYEYQGYTFSTYCIGDKPGAPDEPVYVVFNSNRGIHSRTFKDASGTQDLGTWTYTTARYWDFFGECPRDYERVTKVLSPYGDATVHYFYSHWPGGWPYGLPYSYFQASGTYQLSVEYFDGDTTIACDNEASPYRCTTTGTPKRRAWVEYTSDTPPTSGPDTEKYDTNRRVLAEKTLYEEDDLDPEPERYASTAYSSFDGLGHYRTATTAGDFEAGNIRSTTTNYNPASGSYPGSFTPPLASAAWLLNTYSYQDLIENGVTARQELCFDSTTGFLTRVRTLKNGTSRHATDLLAIYTPDTSTGNRIREQYHGGDRGSLNLAPICDALLETGAYEYRIDHQYDYGTLKKSQYYTTGGSPFTFLSVDRDIDLNTGLVKKSRDVAGIETAYTYDALGRMTWAKPTTGNGAWVENAYVPYGADYARVETYQRPNGSTTGVLARRSLRFDHLGRPFLEKQLLPDSSCGTPPCWNQRKTVLNGQGWTVKQSEWYLNGTADGSMKWTVYDSYDPFGRPLLIQLPDYTEVNNHKIEFVYRGVRETKRKTWIATSAGGETDSTTTEVYDRQGRLWRVIEPSGSSDADVTTTYTYDVGNRLSGASTVGAVTQTRSFTYDNRGFLTSEVVPEVGSTGGGTRTYSKYDSRGHLGRYQDGLHDIAYDYDDAERLTIVAQADASGNPNLSIKLKELTYATANTTGNYKLGKLETAVAYHPEIPVSVTETYTYGGLAGRVSSRQTVVEGHTITQAFTWNDLGLIASVGYPDTNLLNNTSQEPTRSVTYSYANGFLTSIPSYASSISYHVNTMVNRIDHANAVKVDHTIDPDNMRRPRQITLTNATGAWTYGNYAYDGAGNIKAINTDTYVYDKVSRLTSGSFATASCGTKSQTAAYNPFGFMTSTTTTDWGTQSFTELSGGLYNRISGVGYDAAGNTTTWGSYSYTWNRLNQMLTATSGANHTFIYTADGERVSDRVGSTKTITIRDLSNKVLRIYAYNGSAWSWSKDYVYREGQLLATVEPPFAGQVTKHVHLDHLGTPRRITNSSRAIIATHDYYPFGMEACGTADGERMKFTGHERDLQGTTSQTDDLDYMHARYYNPNVARFLSVDPGRDVDPKVPQAWNMYAYARGNPVKFVDPDGKAIETPWDAFNVALDVTSLAANIAAGNIGGAAVDVFGLLLDTAATATPGVPGGAGSAIKAYRAAQAATDVAAVVKVTDNLSGVGFRSFSSFKRMLGAAGGGQAWHHIVEQTSGNISRFGAQSVHNSANVISLPKELHQKISAYYSSKQAFTNGMTVRKWLSTKSYKEQLEFGLNLLKDQGVK
jgi:RHS repeat-associated protein